MGHCLEIIKGVGTALEVDAEYGLSGFRGTHGIGHVRLATESVVDVSRAHPFWAYGFNDVAIVHNGQITNYFKMKRRLMKRGYQFRTDNDSELIAVYLADKLDAGTHARRGVGRVCAASWTAPSPSWSRRETRLALRRMCWRPSPWWCWNAMAWSPSPPKRCPSSASFRASRSPPMNLFRGRLRHGIHRRSRYRA